MKISHAKDLDYILINFVSSRTRTKPTMNTVLRRGELVMHISTGTI